MARTYSFEPQGIIYVYRHVPLDNTYQHTLHFKTRADQLRYFNIAPHSPVTSSNEFMKLEFHGQTVTRNERKIIHVDHNYADLMDCNYVAYLNKPFASPDPTTDLGIWVFGFIISVEYKNDYVTDIEFEIDVMQTFMWNYALRECFVEREHSLTDNIGDSLTPEPITDMPLQTTQIQQTDLMEIYDVVFFTVCRVSTHDGSDSPQLVNRQEPYFQQVGGVPFGGDYVYFKETATVEMRKFIKLCGNAGALESLVTAIIFPKEFAEDPALPHIIRVNKPQQISGYTPKNNKLFTYPYNSLIVDNGQSEIVLRYEYFNPDAYGDNDIKFVIRAFLSGQPQIRCEPLDYGAFNTDIAQQVRNPEAKYVSVMEHFPVVAFGGNNAANWLEQNALGLTITTALDFGEIIGGTLAGEPRAIVGGVSALGRDVGNVITKMNTPATMRTNTQSFSDVLDHDRDFQFKCVQLCKEGAKIVDDFFTMYGYNTQQVKIPNIKDYDTCRPSFNYIKCSNISYDWELRPDGASVPHKYMKKITEIYNNGITFWKNPDRVGRYGDNNAPS